MRLKLLKYRTRALAKNNRALHANLPYRQAHSVGIIFTVEDRQKHEDIKDFMKRLEHDGKSVEVMAFLPRNRENYDFLFDFFSERDLNFWGKITSESANKFSEKPFDFLFCLDVEANPLVMNVVARSKAKCRVGRYQESSSACFEFMLEVKNGTRALIDGIYRYCSKLR